MADKIIIDVELRQGEAKKRADELAAAINRQKTARRELLKAQKDANREFGAESEQAQRAAAALNDNANVTKALRRELNVFNRVVRTGGDSLDAQRANLARLNLAYDSFKVGVDGTEEELSDLREEIQKLDSAIKGNEESTGRFQRSVGDYSKAFRDAFTGNLPVLANFQTLLAGPVGIITALVTGIGALGVKLFEMSGAIAQAKLQTEQLTQAQGDYALVVAAQGQAIQEVYGVELPEALTAANTLTQELGGSIADNTEALGNAAALTGDRFGEVLDIVREYPGQFRELNIGARDFLAIATQQVQDGIYSDKGVDALKEGLLRLREMPDATRNALDSIGVSGEEIQKRIQDGSSTLFEELQNVSSEISKLDPQAEATGKVIANVFGGPGEDAGIRYIASLQDINLNFEELTGNATEAQQQLIRQQEAAASLNRSFNFLLDSSGQFIEEAKTGFKEFLAEGLVAAINGIEELINGFVDLYNNSLPVRAFLNLLFANIKTGIDIAVAGFQRLVNSVSTIGSVIKAALTGNFSDIPDIIRDGLNQGQEIASNLGSNIADNYADGFEETVNGRLAKVDLIPSDEQLKVQEARLLSQAQSTSGKLFSIYKRQAEQVEDLTVESQDILNQYLISQSETLEEKANELLIKQRNNLAEFNLQVQEAIREEQEKTAKQQAKSLAETTRIQTEELQKISDARQQVRDSEIATQQTVLRAVQATTAGIIKAKGEESKAAKAALAIQKVAAAAEIGINLQKELAAINVASAALAASAPPATIPIAAVYKTQQTIQAIVKAAVGLAKVAGFEDGGFTFDGPTGLKHDGYPVYADPGLMDRAGFVNKPTLSLLGRNLALTGERNKTEYIVSHDMLQLPAVRSFVNQIESGRIRPYADGGFSSTVVNNQALNFDIANQLSEGLANMPRQVLVVQDVEAGIGQSVDVRSSGDF